MSGIDLATRRPDRKRSEHRGNEGGLMILPTQAAGCRTARWLSLSQAEKQQGGPCGSRGPGQPRQQPAGQPELWPFSRRPLAASPGAQPGDARPPLAPSAPHTLPGSSGAQRTRKPQNSRCCRHRGQAAQSPRPVERARVGLRARTARQAKQRCGHADARRVFAAVHAGNASRTLVS